MDTALDSYQLSARTLREATKDKSYRAYPMGQRGGEYLRWKRGRITPATYTSIETFLNQLAREFPDLELSDFEPPVGTERIEEFMDVHWGNMAPSTYNVNLTWAKDFFKWAVLRGYLHGDPTLPLERHKKRDVHREIFGDSDKLRIVADGPHPDHLRRDRICLRLLIKYALRKGALRAIQFKHFDANRRRLTVFTKGGKVRELPIVDQALWDDLEKLMFEIDAEPHHFLLSRQKSLFRGYDEKTGNAITKMHQYPEKPMGNNGAHKWWYGCLQRAGIVPSGVESGERMHKARHTAGQALLDKTHGDIKAVQKLLGHSSIKTTGDIYTDWDVDQLAETLKELEDA